jgi:uncharacterized protein (DUF2141 family)
MMRARFGFAALGILLAASSAGAQVIVRDPSLESRTAEAPAGTGRITVVVTTQEGGAVQPTRRASVVLANASTGFNRTEVTDDEGKFTFEELPPGRYTLEAAKGGYVRMPYGARRYDMPGTPIVLANGQDLGTLQMELPRGAVIAGTILDASGKPALGATALVMQWRVVEGMRKLISPAALRAAGALALAPVDPAGAYRFYGLPAGEYVVSVRLRNPPPPGQMPGGRGGPTIAYSTTYYPGTAEPNASVAIKVDTGEERTGADFRAQLTPASNVSGTVTLPGGSPRSTRLVLVPDGPFANGVNTAPDGRFVFSGVPPGQYTIWARSLPAGPSPVRDDAGPAWWGTTTFATSGTDLTDVAIAMQPSMTASGKVVFEAGRAPGPTLAGIDVALTPVQTITNLSYALRVVAKTNAAGAWTIPGLTPGNYTLQAVVTGAAAGQKQWIVKSAIAGGRDLLDFPAHVGPNESLTDIVVTLTDVTQELSGVFGDSAGGHPAGFTMVLFPEDPRLRGPGSRRVRTAQPGTDGRFAIANLPAGTYRLAVVRDLGPDDTASPAFLEQLVQASIPVTLAPGETKVQDVRIQ